MDRYNKYQTKQYTHTHTHAHTAGLLVGDQYLAGWPPRKTIRFKSMRKSIEIWSGNKYITITITITIPKLKWHGQITSLMIDCVLKLIRDHLPVPLTSMAWTNNKSTIDSVLKLIRNHLPVPLASMAVESGSSDQDEEDQFFVGKKVYVVWSRHFHAMSQRYIRNHGEHHSSFLPEELLIHWKLFFPVSAAAGVCLVAMAWLSIQVWYIILHCKSGQLTKLDLRLLLHIDLGLQVYTKVLYENIWSFFAKLASYCTRWFFWYYCGQRWLNKIRHSLCVQLFASTITVKLVSWVIRTPTIIRHCVHNHNFHTHAKSLLMWHHLVIT